MMRTSRRLFVGSCAALLALATSAVAQSADEVAKQADQTLRAAERSMFAGKIEDATSQFAKGKDLVAKLASQAPEHRRLKTLQSKRDKLQRDLERRAPKKPAAERPEAEVQDAGATRLPGGVTKRLRDVDAQLRRLRGYMATDSAASPASRVETARGHIAGARTVLAEIEKNYGKDVPDDHPSLIAARARIAAAEQEIATFERRLVAAAEAPAPTDPASADREKVESMHAKFYQPLDLIHGNSLVYGPSVANAQEALDQITAIEKDVLPVLEPALAVLTDKYGTEAMAIDTRLHELGVPPRERFARKLEDLIRGARNVRKSRLASAEDLANNVEMMSRDVDRMSPDVRVKRLQESKARLLVAQQLDPNNAKVNEQLTGIDARIDATAAKIEADIDAAAWAGHVEDFPGPGEVEGLAKAAMDYFQKDSRWGGNDKLGVEVLNVAVRGPWQVAERDIFGRTIRWRLPIHLAITNPTLRERGVARVYELSAVALEGTADQAEKAPPFDGYWVGDNWMMRLTGL